MVGAGIAGAACAVQLRRGGLGVDVLERGRAPGGRLASPEVRNRRVDLGAAYFTVADEGFRCVVDDWAGRGLARPWTDTMDAFSADGQQTTRGPMRWAARGGLRSLVHDLLVHDRIAEPVLGVEVDDVGALPHDAVVLAMPDPQAARLAGDAFDWVDFEPVIAVALSWDERCWPIADAAFVNDDPDITLVADDGARRGDGAPVLVAHTTAELAREHLAAPDGVIEAVRAALTRVLGVVDDPWWTHAHRWTFAKPAGTHGDEPYGLLDSEDRPLAVCGDAWCPSGSPRVEAAWLSGTRLGATLAGALS